MTLPFFIDSVIIEATGNIRTTESKYSAGSIEDSLWECRAAQIQAIYKKTSRIQPIWTQQYLPDFSKDLQDEKNIIKFEIPPVVQLDEFALGFMYIGSVDCLNQYRLFRSRAEYSAYRQHRVQRESTVPAVIYSDNILEVHNTALNKIALLVDGVFYNPTLLPTFNRESSDIPLDGENLAIARQMIVQTFLNPGGNKKPYLKQDNTQQ